MTAECEVCGPVWLASKGRGRWACGRKEAARQARKQAAMPAEKQAARRAAPPSPHRLVQFNPSTRTGDCPVCGLVGIVPKGRGWMCEKRAGELWSRQQDEPQGRCGVCNAWLAACGACRGCADQSDLDWGDMLTPARSKRLSREGRRLSADFGSEAGMAESDAEGEAPYRGGYSVIHTEVWDSVTGEMVESAPDAWAMDDYESAVPGWKTIGSGRPWPEVTK